MERRDIAIIGTGPGGVSAAITAKIRGKQLWLFGTRHLSEKLEKAKTILNYPGLPAVSGMALADGMRAQLKSLNIPILETQVTAVYAMGDYFAIQTPTEMYEASAVILAAGVVMGKPFPGEKELLGRGVSYCATCDGMLYRGREVAIVGGGNTAVGDALTLARLAGRVTLIHRRDALRASAVYLDKLRENGVNIVWNTEVKALQGDDRLTGLVLRNKVTGEESTLPVDGLFVAVGRRPETALFRGQLETDEAGYLIADETTRTSLPGVYAVGDVRRKPVRQILTAAADGAVAAHYIEEYLAGNRA